MQEPMLKAITMKNIKSLIEPARLEFNALTLLFGPNSAGKSIFLDATSIMMKIFNEENDWRQEKKDLISKFSIDSSGNRTGNMEISLEINANLYEAGADFWEPEEVLEGLVQPADFNENEALVFSLVLGVDSNDECFIVSLEVSNDECSILKLTLEDEFQFYIVEFQECRFIKLNDFLKFDPAEIDSFDEKRFPPRTPNSLIAEKSRARSSSVAEQDWANNPLSMHFLSAGTNDPNETEHRIVSYSYRNIIKLLSNALVKCLKEIDLVPASRIVPEPKDLFFVNNHSLIRSSLSYSEQYHFGRLARFGAISKLVDKSDFNAQLRSDADKFTAVNDYLSDFLFLEKGYQANVDVFPLITTEQIDQGYTGDITQPYIANLFLRDFENRKLQLGDVGSGVGYFLPVLVSLVQESISFIQQPELHLHPALQGRLADVFISTVNNHQAKQIIIETHSEHIVLRILRRIRTAQTMNERSLKIQPQNLSIYYFDPIPSNGTNITKMAVAPNGDFYNSWPNGFFTERDEDLFS